MKKKQPIISKLTREYIDEYGVKTFFAVLEKAVFGCHPKNQTGMINILAQLHLCREYCSEGSVMRQEIDALHSKVWATLEASLC